MDVYSKETRSAVMKRVKSRDTRPEVIVRKALHASGYRYRLHLRELPGTPDIVFPRQKKIILVHGCFWHQHEGCPHAARPSSNISYWTTKLDRNIGRDSATLMALRDRGWEVLVVWECQTGDRK